MVWAGVRSSAFCRLHLTTCDGFAHGVATSFFQQYMTKKTHVNGL